MRSLGAEDVPTAETLRFLERALSRDVERVLEVGCGRGAVAFVLSARGFEVVALDASAEAARSARAAGVPAREEDFLRHDAAPYDAVLFTRSLHHIPRLEEALDRARALLRPGGLLIAEEFGVDRMDAKTAWWFYELQLLLREAGALPDEAEDRERALPDDPLRRWREDHAEHPLHASTSMRVAISRRFKILGEEVAPYLYRYFCEGLPAGERGARLARRILEWETRGIELGSLRPLGLRIVGTPHAGRAEPRPYAGRAESRPHPGRAESRRPS